jgi:hypothetical protein
MKKTVTSKLMGGLGNQMFQISTAYAYGKKFELDIKFDFNHCFTPLQGNPSSKYANNFFSNLTSFIIDQNFLKDYVVFNENNKNFEEIPYFGSNVLLSGYFQNKNYFLTYEDEIKNLFKFSEESNEKVNNFINKLKNKETTSIHVRRGDYLNFPNIHPTCDKEYYQKTMEKFIDVNFIIVSDDINWCKENIKGDNIFYSDFTDEIDDLNLLKKCDNNIIANSTFSWWGAFLNENKKKKIFAPKTWFGESGPEYGKNIVPINWIKL